MEDLSKRLEELKGQQENARNLFLKLQGAIEFTEGLIQTQSNPEKKVVNPEKTVAKPNK